jgi:hypothetical protein
MNGLEQGLGIFYLILGISFSLNANKLWFPLLEKLKEEVYIIYLGLFALTIGTGMILTHNIWSFHPAELLTTVTGWGLFLEGIRYLFFPGTILLFIPKSLTLVRFAGGFLSILTGALILLTAGGLHWIQ